MSPSARRLAALVSAVVAAGCWADSMNRGRHALLTAIVLLGAGAALAIGTWLPLVRAVSGQPQVGVAIVMLATTLVLMGLGLLFEASSGFYAPIGMDTHRRPVHSGLVHAPRVAFVGAYLALLAWFRYFDVWGVHFADGGAHYGIYNLARAAFVLYLAIVLIETGRLASHLFTPNSLGEQAGRPGTLDAFYLGAAVWVVGGYVLGLVQGIYWAPLAAITSVLVWRGYPAARRLGESALCAIGRLRSPSLSSLAWACALLCSLALIVALVAVNEGFAVFGFEYDSSGHYLPYYAQVVAQHSTEPNEYWYHFWVSKGAFLHFLSVALTDIQGPQLVSFLLLLAALAAAYGVIQNITGDWRWGAAGAVVLAAPFISQFHFFQKHHIVTLSLVAGLLWLSRSADSDARHAPVWQARALALMGAALLCNTPPMAAVVLPYLFCLGLWMQRRRGLSLFGAFLPFVAGSIAIVGMLCLNQAWTGLAEVTPFKIFLSFADQEKLSRHVSPYLLLLAEEGSSETTGRLSLDTLSSWRFVGSRLKELLRTQGLMPSLAAALPLIVLAGAASATLSRRFRQAFARHLGATLLLVSVAVAFGFFVNQPGSIERFYTFAYYPLVILAVGSAGLLWWIASERRSGGATRGLMQLVAAILTAGVSFGTACYWISHYLRLDGPAYVLEKASFLAGRRSFEDALTYVHLRGNEGGWPRRDLSQECLAVRDFLSDRGARYGGAPPKAWTLTFLQESGCHVLPGVQIQMEFSVRFGAHWHRIVFGSPGVALEELKRIGVSHFYVNLADFDTTRTERISTSFFGCLAYSPLFQPDALESRFRIAWRNGDALLLAIADGDESSGTRITEEFMEKWSHKISAVQPGLGEMAALCGRLAHYYRTQGERWPVAVDRSLPQIKGWQ